MIVDDGYQFTCGLHGMRTIFDVLTRYGYAETLFKTVTNTQHYGYGYSVSHGFRTLPEHFAFDVKLAGARTRVCSRNHHYMSFVDTWFFEYLAGIQVLGFGQEGVRIARALWRGSGRFGRSCAGFGWPTTRRKSAWTPRSPSPLYTMARKKHIRREAASFPEDRRGGKTAVLGMKRRK